MQETRQLRGRYIDSSSEYAIAIYRPSAVKTETTDGLLTIQRVELDKRRALEGIASKLAPGIALALYPGIA